MNKNFRAVAMLLGASMLACAVQAQTAAATYPARTVHLIVPFAPGAFTDGSARLLAKELSVQTGQTFVVENKVGASGAIGADYVAKAAPDGYTLLITETSFAMTPALNPRLPYDAVRDLVPVSQYADATAVLMMRNGLGVSSVKELVAMARAAQGKLSFGSAGTGSSSHLPIEWFSSLADVKMLHVPFKGAAASIPELIAGRVDLVMSSVATGGPHIAAGKVAALAVTGKERSPALPNVPTFAEAGFPEYRMSYWFGLFAPAATPRDVVARLEREVARAMTSPALREAFARQGAQPIGSSSAEFTRFVGNEIDLWKKVVVSANVKMD
jgi:tripartite-type tricarboxylate transporter receptor subunit TctC